MDESKITCPYCEQVNNPLDDENTQIGFTVMECQHCDKNFYMSRQIDIIYDTWT